MTSCLFNH